MKQSRQTFTEWYRPGLATPISHNPPLPRVKPASLTAVPAKLIKAKLRVLPPKPPLRRVYIPDPAPRPAPETWRNP